MSSKGSLWKTSFQTAGPWGADRIGLDLYLSLSETSLLCSTWNLWPQAILDGSPPSPSNQCLVNPTWRRSLEFFLPKLSVGLKLYIIYIYLNCKVMTKFLHCHQGFQPHLRWRWHFQCCRGICIPERLLERESEVSNHHLWSEDDAYVLISMKVKVTF